MPTPTLHEPSGYPLNWQGGRLHHSHSAAETLSLCARKYFYSYILRLITPPSAAAEFGVVCHDLLERMCKAGHDWHNVLTEAREKIPNHARVLECTFPNLPWVRLEGLAPWPMPPHWNSETRVYLDAFGLKLKGFVDLWTYHLIPALSETGKSMVITDLKVSGNPKRWCKDADELAHFGQPLKYGYSLAKQLGIEPERIYAEHLYAKRTGKATSFVVNARTGDDLGIPWENVEKHWQTRVKRDTAVMQRLHTIADPEKVEPDTQGCRAFGGCEYADICPAHPKNYIPFKKTVVKAQPSVLTLPSKPGKNRMSASNALRNLSNVGKKKKRKGSRPSITPQGAKSAIDRAVAATGGDLPDAARKLMERGGPKTQPKPPAAPTLSNFATAVMDAVKQGETLDWDGIKAINKTVAAAAGKTRVRFFASHADKLLDELDGQVSVGGTSKDKTLVLSLQGAKAAAPPAPSEPSPEPQPPEETPEAVEAAPAPTPSALDTTPPTSEGLVDEPAQSMGQRSQPNYGSTNSPATFYFGCLPEFERAVHIDVALAPLYTRAEESLGITHWQSSKFGEGVKHVSAQLARQMKVTSLLTESIYTPSGHPLWGVFNELLRRNGYDRLVMG